MRDWENYSLEDFISFNPKETIPKGALSKKIAMEDLGIRTKHFSCNKNEEFSSGSKFRNGDTLFARITPCLENGKIGYVKCLEENEVAFGSTEFIVMRAKPGISNSDFVFYLGLWEELRSLAIQTMKGTSGRQRVDLDDLKTREFLLPPLAEQEAIAEVLSSLDDQIELLTKQNETLDALLLNSFLQRVQNGNPPEDDDLIALDKEIDFLNGLACQKYAPNSESKLPVIKIKELNAGAFSKDSNFCRDDVPSKYLVHFGDIIFSWSGTLVVKLWPNEPGVLNQHLFKVTSDLYPDWFIFCWLKYHLPVFQEIARGKATTMGHIQRHHLSEAMITEKNLLDDASFVERQSSLFNKLKANDLLIYQLRRTRDALLPQLMSGALRVGDAKRVIAEEVSRA
ncbi:restriction endonuclease subunit S [Trueperella sp. LYQ141]|uniref:restriction endonuclease subunit S n=1 Tax=Trueperella sp. LYQ141 TaxID=3391058 RepID=UPI003982EDC0